jgi:hypothetical protein
MFKLFSIILFFVISIFAFGQNTNANGYIIILGGYSLKNEKVEIRCRAKGYLDKVAVTTNPSIDIDPKHLYLDSSYGGLTLEVVYKRFKKKLAFKLPYSKLLSFVYIWFDSKEISYEIRDEPLILM